MQCKAQKSIVVGGFRVEAQNCFSTLRQKQMHALPGCNAQPRTSIRREGSALNQAQHCCAGRSVLQVRGGAKQHMGDGTELWRSTTVPQTCMRSSRAGGGKMGKRPHLQRAALEDRHVCLEASHHSGHSTRAHVHKTDGLQDMGASGRAWCAQMGEALLPGSQRDRASQHPAQTPCCRSILHLPHCACP